MKTQAIHQETKEKTNRRLRRRNRRLARMRSLAASALLGASLLSPAAALANPGDLDTTFSGDGIRIHRNSYCSPQGGCGPMDRSTMSGVAVSSESRAIVTVGHSGLYTWAAPVVSGVGYEFRPSRLFSAAKTLENGDADAAFAGPSTGPEAPFNPVPGTVQWNHESTGARLHAVALSEPGSGWPSAVAAGYVLTFSDMHHDRDHFVVAGLREDGLLDPGFGTNGLVKIAPWATIKDGLEQVTAAYDIVRRADGSMLAVGIAKGDVALAQLRSDGSLDPAFAGDGMMTLSFGDSYGALSVAEDSSGRIVIAASNVVDHSVAISDEEIVVARLTDSGLDSTFGGTGFIRVPGGFFGAGKIDTIDIAVDSQDRIVLSSGTLGTLVKRFLVDGTPDPTFGSSAGSVSLTGGVARSIAVDGKDRVFVAGAASNQGGTTGQAWIARLDETGSLDPVFAGTGERAINIPWSDRESVFDIALEGQGHNVVLTGGLSWGASDEYYDKGWFVARVLGGPFCFDGRIDVGEVDTDGDGVEDRCDNCIDICNPDQEDSDGDCPAGELAGGAECGDVCDACPAHVQEDQPAECTDAYYNSVGIDCCFEIDSTAVSSDPICTGTPEEPVLVRVGGADLPAGSGSLWGEGNPPGGAILKVPAATAGGHTFSITAKNKGASERNGYVKALHRFVGAYEFAPQMTFAGAGDAPATVCIEWVDNDDNGRLDTGRLGTGRPYISPEGIRERNLQLRRIGPAAEHLLGNRCSENLCGAIGADGTPTDWGGHVRADDPSLGACCSMETNRWCYETRSFEDFSSSRSAGAAAGRMTPASSGSMFAIDPDCSAGFDKAQLKYKAGSGKMIFKAEYRLATFQEQQGNGFFDPMKTGASIEIFDAQDNLLFEIPLQAGAFGKKQPGWKSNRAGDVFTYLDKSPESLIKKVQLKRNDRRDPSEVSIKLITKNLDIPANALSGELSLQFRLGDGEPGNCAVTDFASEVGGRCATNPAGDMLSCRTR